MRISIELILQPFASLEATTELTQQLTAFSGRQVTSHLPSSVYWGEDPSEAQNPPRTQRTLIHLEHHPLICLHHFI